MLLTFKVCVLSAEEGHLISIGVSGAEDIPLKIIYKRYCVCLHLAMGG